MAQPAALSHETIAGILNLTGFKTLRFLTEFARLRKNAWELSRLLTHRFEKIFIGLGATHFIEQEFHRYNDAQL
jgi:hypothetical protein